jgi:hypothetical protein
VRAALAIALALLAAPLQAQQRTSLNIVNEGLIDVEIGVLDQVCDAVVYRGHLVPNTETTIECCHDADGRCKLVIEDHQGHRQAFDGVPGTIYLKPR